MAEFLCQKMTEKMTDSEDTSAIGGAPDADGKPTRSGFVALIGPTNAGKSTLVNRFVGAKVSIVSHKVQTTRAVVRGIAIHNNAQIASVMIVQRIQPGSVRALSRAA